MTYEPVPLHRLEVPAPNALPFAIGSFDTIGPLSRAGFPHRHVFHEIVYVTSGRGTHVVDAVPWRLSPPNLCAVAPGQVHHWRGVSGLNGWVVLFTDDFLLEHPEDREKLRGLRERPWLRPPREEAVRLSALLREMDREYRGRGEGFASVLQSYLHVLLVRASRLPGGVPPAAAAGPEGGRVSGAAREFGRLLEEPEAGRLSVRECAARLGVSAGHLNETVKRATGRTPGQLLRRARVLEAKRLLTGTGMTVGQVARQAGFADPAYFCRFFRRETGVTPGAFRSGAGEAGGAGTGAGAGTDGEADRDGTGTNHHDR
ncbi:AraC family transcriptional regulator [Streptomyces chitinivorans]|uniref:AraC family transcriptional regulator n=1 Tax=Streptomyces chitinivorans TaxID=1257027 RepID=A0ABW7HUN7_9ACTN|nr:AraC family transcriptional regulator [Streptomyces chitinivorans]MDH2408660.1 AraC family transcriptional regulator [Streptomyces chitinivorans]